MGQLSATYRLLVGFALAALAWGLAPAGMDTISRCIGAWDAYAGASLLLIAAAMFTADAATIRKVANTEDPSRALAFGFVLVAALASLLAVVALMNAMDSLSTSMLVQRVALSAGAVLEAWLLVHTVFTLRYAHLYYDTNEAHGGDTGGLDFPGHDPEPDYLDFAYFAFVVGMTAQTSDVCVSGRPMRRAALLHGIVSYVFNTAVVALSIGVLTTLL